MIYFLYFVLACYGVYWPWKVSQQKKLIDQLESDCKRYLAQCDRDALADRIAEYKDIGPR